MPRTVAVIGAGVSGLAVTYELRKYLRSPPDGVRAICFEASDRPGGNIRTVRKHGYTCEWGPNGFLDNVPATLELVRRLGMNDRLQQADEQAALRYIYRAGALREVPAGAGAFLKSSLLSLPGKLRLLGEPFARRRPGDRDESVFEFAARRIGAEAAEVLVGAMVNGVYAGNVRELCLRSTFPKMYAMESDYGGLLKAMIAKRRTGGGGPAGPGGVLTSFREGLDTLIRALAEAAGGALRLNSPVRAVSDMGGRGFRLQMETGAPIDVHAVVLACPAWRSAPLVQEADPVLSRAMAGIPGASLAVVHLGYSAGALGSRPRGFGFLAPRGQGIRSLGCLWSSNIFPGRAPEGKILMTAMIGGAQDPEIVEESDEAIVRTVRKDLQTAMDLQVAPEFVEVIRHRFGIPQYTVGHQDRLRTIRTRLKAHPGLLVCGNSYEGISVNHCVEEASGIADEAARFLGS